MSANTARGKSATSNNHYEFKPIKGECPVCDHSGGWCQVDKAGCVVMCRRESAGAWKADTDANGVDYYLHQIKDDPTDYSERPRATTTHEGPTPPAADIETRHSVYSAALALLDLEGNHREDLNRRGLSDAEIDRREYRTLPDRRGPKLAQELAQRFGVDAMVKVPGFFLDTKGKPSFSCLPGLLIPVRDLSGRIGSLMIRPTKKLDGGGKYLSVSSKSKGGPSPGAPVHIPLDAPDSTLWRLTEGQLKADISTVISGIPALGMQGVSWVPAITVLKATGCTTVRLAFDADAATNKIVAGSMLKCAEALVANGFAIEYERWDWKDGKGIDDVLAAGKPTEVVTGPDALVRIREVAVLAGVEVLNVGFARDRWSATATDHVADEPPAFQNYYEEPTASDPLRTVRVPLRMEQIYDALIAISGGWPKRVGPMLFVEGSDGKPYWLDSPAKLFAWIDRKTSVHWTKGGSFITQERLFEDLKTHAERFDAVEVCPHFPPMPRTYYMHAQVGGSAGKLDRLIKFFNPATVTDAYLILAFILTLFWGGHPGRRPAFLFTGPDIDSENGRGLGKSTLTEILSQELVGGFVEVPPDGDMEAVKTRLLSPGAAYIRVARLDNVKKLRFSWAELEGIITASAISGKRLYQGEGSRVNTLLWAITINGESVSEDLAQRCTHIKLKRPEYSPTWEAEVRGYIRENLSGLWGDIKHALANPNPEVVATGRWAEWECGVLAATPDTEDTQLELITRRKAMNADQREAGEFESYLRTCFEAMGHKSSGAYLSVPSAIMAEWLDRAERRKYPANKASARIRGFGIPNLTKRDERTFRGWVWRGEEHDGKGEPETVTESQAFPERFRRF